MIDIDWILKVVEILSKLAIPVGGGIGLYLAYLRVAAANEQAAAQTRQADASARQADIGRRKLVNDLFKEAVAQLADEKLEKRLFAIYTLIEIAKDAPDDSKAVVELLTAYLRENGNRWEIPPPDILVIMDFLASSLRKQS